VMVCQLYGMVDTICHHAGIQIYPSWWDTNIITKWYLSPQYHDVHHEKVRHPVAHPHHYHPLRTCSPHHTVAHNQVSCNYGGFTTIYDHLFGTVYHGYSERVCALKARIEGAGAEQHTSSNQRKET